MDPKKRMQDITGELGILRKSMEDTIKNLAGFRKNLEDAKGDDVSKIETQVTKAQTDIDGYTKSMKILCDEYERCKEQSETIARTKAISDNTDTTKVISPGGAGRLAAEPNDAASDERVRRKAFYNVMRDHGRSTFGSTKRYATEADYNAVRPKNQTLANGGNNGQDNAENVAIPTGMWLAAAGITKSVTPMLSTDDQAAGGRAYAFYPEMDTTLGKEDTPLPALFAAVTKKSVSGGAWIGPRADQTDEDDFAGVKVFRFDEGTELPGTEMKLKQDRIDCYPLGALSAFSKQLLSRDQVGFEREFLAMLREAWTWRLNKEIMTGSGTKECLGILNDTDVEFVASEAPNTVGYADLIRLKHSLRPRFRANCSWYMSDSVEEVLEKQKDDIKRPLFAATVASGPYNRLVNYPYVIDESMPSIASPNGRGCLMLGDLSKYWLAMEEEGVIATSEHALFTQGLVAVRIMGLVGGKLRWKRGVKLIDAAGVGG